MLSGGLEMMDSQVENSVTVSLTNGCLEWIISIKSSIPIRLKLTEAYHIQPIVAISLPLIATTFQPPNSGHRPDCWRGTHFFWNQNVSASLSATWEDSRAANQPAALLRSNTRA